MFATVFFILFFSACIGAIYIGYITDNDPERLEKRVSKKQKELEKLEKRLFSQQTKYF